MARSIITTIAVICLVMVMLSLGSCTPRAPVSDPRQVWCDFSKPRRDATAETPRWVIDEINTHNRRGTDWCGWTP